MSMVDESSTDGRRTRQDGEDVTAADAAFAPRIDTLANRKSRKWSRKAIAGRIGWACCQPLFRLSPRPLWSWRRWLLRRFGAVIGANVHIYPSVRITIPWNLSVGDASAIGDRAIVYALGPISLGSNVTVSQGVHLCAGTHDYRDPALRLLKPPITIEDSAWICADAFVGPGVTVGAAAIVGARAVAVKDVPAGMIVGGNPARVLRRRSDDLRRIA
jgi:putative colanic acid biosynthesis acetyltransferase WcaF